MNICWHCKKYLHQCPYNKKNQYECDHIDYMDRDLFNTTINRDKISKQGSVTTKDILVK